MLSSQSLNRQEYHEFKVSLGYTISPTPSRKVFIKELQEVGKGGRTKFTEDNVLLGE